MFDNVQVNKVIVVSAAAIYGLLLQRHLKLSYTRNVFKISVLNTK